MASVDVRGTSIHYAERNAQRADALVLLHAFPVHGGMWREVMDGLPAAHALPSPRLGEHQTDVLSDPNWVGR